MTGACRDLPQSDFSPSGCALGSAGSRGTSSNFLRSCRTVPHGSRAVPRDQGARALHGLVSALSVSVGGGGGLMFVRSFVCLFVCSFIALAFSTGTRRYLPVVLMSFPDGDAECPFMCLLAIRISFLKNCLNPFPFIFVFDSFPFSW